MSGQFKGKMGLRVKRSGAKLSVKPKEYEFKMDLHIRKSAPSQLSLFLSFIDKFKTTTNSGSRYLFKIGASNPKASPSLDPIRKL